MSELLAQNNGVDAAAFQAGQAVGIVLAMIICFAIPFGVGMSRGQPVIGTVGGLLAGGSAFPCGCLLGLPIAGLFVVIILLTTSSTSNSRRRTEDDYDRDRYRDDDDR